MHVHRSEVRADRLPQVVPVLYAFSLMLVVTAVYAVLASQLFSDRSPEQFGRFSLALLTVRVAP